MLTNVQRARRGRTYLSHTSTMYGTVQYVEDIQFNATSRKLLIRLISQEQQVISIFCA
jgi:hypothetical protein